MENCSDEKFDKAVRSWRGGWLEGWLKQGWVGERAGCSTTQAMGSGRRRALTPGYRSTAAGLPLHETHPPRHSPTRPPTLAPPALACLQSLPAQVLNPMSCEWRSFTGGPARLRLFGLPDCPAVPSPPSGSPAGSAAACSTPLNHASISLLPP